MQGNIGNCFIQFTKGSYAAGEQVSGAILLNITMQINAPTSVKITFTGKESTKVLERYETGSGDSRKVHYRPHYQTNFFFNHTYPIYIHSSPVMSAGQYNLPFTFMLPQGIPSSFSEEFETPGGFNHGKIEYLAHCYVEVAGQHFNPIHSSQPFSVNQPLYLNEGNKKMEIFQEVTSWCCCKKGNVHLTTYFEKDQYEFGETACMIAEVDNSNCKALVKNINGYFIQEAVLHAKGHTAHHSRRCEKIKTPGVPPHEKSVGENARRVNIPLQAMANRQNPSCSGRLVQNKYSLKLKTDMDACICCDKAPQCEIPVSIRNPEFNLSRWGEQPSNWNPQTMSCYNAQISSEFANPDVTPGLPPPPMPGMAMAPQMPAQGSPGAMGIAPPHPSGGMGVPPPSGLAGAPEYAKNQPPQGGSNYPTADF